MRISIHAPHGVRLRRAGAKSWMALFQSTRHTGCDSICISSLYQKYGFQSTRHTGCDGIPLCRYDRDSHFNPRATRGATSFWDAKKIPKLFQSTRHTGCDSACKTFDIPVFIFQSTRHTGCDILHQERKPYCGTISIHAPHGVRLH